MIPKKCSKHVGTFLSRARKQALFVLQTTTRGSRTPRLLDSQTPGLGAL